MNCIIVLDRITPEMKNLLCQETPQDSELIFWDSLDEIGKQRKLAQADAFLTATYIVDDALLSRAPNLKIVQKMGVGTDNIDAAAAATRGVMVRNVPGGNANGVAELTIGLILDLYRKIIVLDRNAKAGIWSMWTYRSSSYEVKGKIHGIVGFGSTGQRVAQLSNAFGASVLYFSRTRKSPEIERKYHVTYIELDELLRRSDIVSIHLPLTPETRNFIDTNKIALMKPNAVLINVGRGNVVDEAALYEALLLGKIAGAGIDVWADEPLKADNPLLKLDNVIATPHVGGGTLDAAVNIFRKSFETISSILAR